MLGTCRKQGSPALFTKISFEKISPEEAALMSMKYTALLSLWVTAIYFIDQTLLCILLSLNSDFRSFCSGQRQLWQRVPSHPSSYRRRASSEGDERRPHHQLLPAQATHGDFHPEESWSPEHYQDPRCLLRETFCLHCHWPLQRRRTFRPAKLWKEPRIRLQGRPCSEADERHAQRCELSTRTWYKYSICF